MDSFFVGAHDRRRDGVGIGVERRDRVLDPRRAVTQCCQLVHPNNPKEAWELWGLEEVFSSWVKSLIWIFTGSAPASTTGWWVSEFTIGTF